MNRLSILFILALAGCGSEEGRDNYGYGWYYDQIGETGLRVRYDGRPAPTLAQIESLYAETKACMGVTATGPLVIFVESIDQANGFTYFYTGTILIKANNWAMTSTLKHEFVHHLLHQSGFSPEANSNHQSNLFFDCSGL